MTALSVAIAAASRIGLDYGFLSDAYEKSQFLAGVGTTLLLVALTLPLSLIFGVLFAAALTSGNRWLAVPVHGFVELTRSTPTLGQLALAFYGLNMLIGQAVGGAQHNPLTAMFWVVAVTSLHTAALHAEALRGGIVVIPPGVIEAARALGLRKLALLRHVELPLALRIALPALINNLVNLVKLSTLGSAIAVGEVTYASILIWTQRDNVLELMILILLLFSLINAALARLGWWLERRLALPGMGRVR